MKKDLITEMHKGKETVLLIDDDEMVADVGERLLKNSGYDVVSAKSGKEAIEVFRESHDRIDIVILDMDLLPLKYGMYCLAAIPLLLASGR